MHTKSLAIAAACWFGLASRLTAQSATVDDAWSAFLRERIGTSSAGYAWVVIERGEIVSQGGGGVLSIDSAGRRGTPMLPTTRMQIASASKPITAMALLLALHERGISVDTPIVALLGDLAPSPGPNVDRVTIRHLLQHKSGYPFGYLWPPRIDSTRAILARPLPNPPGERARYSNINYSLARTILERVSGLPYEEFVQRRFLASVGIKGASLVNVSGDAFAHSAREPVRGKALVWDFRDDAGGYGWYMTARDLARWGWALMSGATVPRNIVENALGDSLGWNRRITSRGPAFAHEGQWIAAQNTAVRTAIALLPDSTVAVLFLNTNVSFSPTKLLVDGFDLAESQRQRPTPPDGELCDSFR